jgi:hypothetical protein
VKIFDSAKRLGPSIGEKGKYLGGNDPPKALVAINDLVISPPVFI